MRIDISKLFGDRELVFHEAWDPKKLEIDSPGIVYRDLLKCEARVKREAGLVVAEIAVSGSRMLTCHRCFADFSDSLEKSFRLVYPLEAGLKFIVIDDDVRDEIILEHPVKILCRQDCRGLCPRCGVDLNESVCKCERNEK